MMQFLNRQADKLKEMMCWIGRYDTLTEKTFRVGLLELYHSQIAFG